MTPQNIDKTFSDINHTAVSLGRSLKAVEIKTKINKWDLMRLKLLHRKEWEKIFTNAVTERGVIAKIYKQLV